MSLQLAARQLAAQGRGTDTTLVHMSQKELMGLQALAQKHGTSLTTNPQTGLPEAGILDNILPAVAGVGLAMYAPEAMGSMGALVGGDAAIGAGLTTGLASTVLSGGNIMKGLMSGLGAYGGYGMGSGLMSAGAQTMADAQAPVSALPTVGANEAAGIANTSRATALAETEPGLYQRGAYLPSSDVIAAPQGAGGIRPSDVAYGQSGPTGFQFSNPSAAVRDVAANSAMPPMSSSAVDSYLMNNRSMMPLNTSTPVADVSLGPLAATPEYIPPAASGTNYYGALNNLNQTAATSGTPLDYTQYVDSVNANNAAREAAMTADPYAAMKAGLSSNYLKNTMGGFNGLKYAGAALAPSIMDYMSPSTNTHTAASDYQNTVRPWTFSRTLAQTPGARASASMPMFNQGFTAGTPYVAPYAGGGLAKGPARGETLRGTMGMLHGVEKLTGYSGGGGISNLGSYSDGGQLLRGPGDGVSDSIPAQIGQHQPARLAEGEFVVPARIVSEIGNGSTDAGAKKLYAMMDRIQAGRAKTMGGNSAYAKDTKADRYMPA